MRTTAPYWCVGLINKYLYITRQFYSLTENKMVVRKTIDGIQLQELRDHRDNTAGELIKCYTMSQISFLDGVDTRTVQTNSKRYLPVRVDSGPAWEKFRRGKQAKPYRIMYVRLDEIKALYNKRTGNKLVVELK